MQEAHRSDDWGTACRLRASCPRESDQRNLMDGLRRRVLASFSQVGDS